MYEVLSRCYPSGATRSLIYRGGGFTPGAKVIILPRNSPDARGKKNSRQTTWNGRVINHIIHHITYKTIMLKKLVNCYYIRKTKKIFRQIISFVAWSDPGKFYRIYTLLHLFFTALSLQRKKNYISLFDYLRFFLFYQPSM